MSDGANTSTACTNCNEQDSITIAGKTFCAHCGTPQSATSQAPAATATPSLSTVAHSSADTPAIQPSPSAASVASVAPAERMPPSNAITSSTANENNDVILQARLKADQLNSAMNTQQSASISKFAATPSEIGSLDDKAGESVMSDETLDELAKATKEPMPSSDNDAGAQPEVKPELTPQDTHDTPVQPPAAKQTEPQDIKESMSTQSIGPASTVQTVSTMPAESSYKLDLTQSATNKLPKAVSDVRPAAPTPVAPSVAASITTPKPTQQPPAPSAAPVATVSAPVEPVAPALSADQPLESILNTPAPTPEAVAPPALSAQPSPVSQQTAAAPSDSVNQPAMPGMPTGATPAPAKPASKGVRASSVALSLVGLLLIGGYIWQVNYPNLALKVAGSKAGISANFPGYVPNGWKLSGNIQSSAGNISYNIANTKTGKSLQVSESKTSWDSQALAENYVAPKSSNYLALQAQGLTIYLYDGNQASWVNNGTWYKVEGSDSGLSQDQIIKLATSL